MDSQGYDRLSRELVGLLTIEEKIAYLCAEHPAIERLGWPQFRLEGEGAHGVLIVADRGGNTRDADSTVFPEPFGLSMTWDRNLLRRIGAAIGAEARAFNKLILFFPTIDLERDPRWGRNEEAYGEDPYLAGTLGVEIIRGAQQGNGPNTPDSLFLNTAATVKHFYANNYEFERDWDDSRLPAHLEHEYYLRVFERAFVEGKAASLMTGYNKIDGTIGMLNPELNSLVRDRWGADAYFISDGAAFELLPQMYADHPGYPEYAAAALNAGLDCFLAYDDSVVIKAVTEALAARVITEAQIDKALERQFRVLLRLGFFDGLTGLGGAVIDTHNPFTKPDPAIVCNDEHSELARQAACEAVVLLKNDGILPLSGATNTIAVIGPLANKNMRDWYSGNPPYEVTPLAGIAAEFPAAKIAFEDGCDLVAFQDSSGSWLRVLEDDSVALDADEDARSVFRSYDWGYGYAFQNVATDRYLTTTDAGEVRCDADDVWGWFTRPLFFIGAPDAYSQLVSWAEAPADSASGLALTDPVSIDGLGFAPEVPVANLVKPVGAKQAGKNMYRKWYSNEGARAANRLLGRLTVRLVDDGLARVRATAAGADATVVVLGNHSLIGARECVDRPSLALPRRYRALFDAATSANPNTILALIAGYQYAIGEVTAKSRATLFTTPGMQEVGTAIGRALSGGVNPAGRLSQTWYADDHRFGALDDYDITATKTTYWYVDRPVQYEFGYGLSYTAFEYTDLVVAGQDVSFSVTNTGPVAGDEVAQVYLSLVESDASGINDASGEADASAQSDASAQARRPRKQLVGYERFHLAPGERRRVNLRFDEADVAAWDGQASEFRVLPGTYRVEVGASSLDIRLSQELHLPIPPGGAD